LVNSGTSQNYNSLQGGIRIKSSIRNNITQNVIVNGQEGIYCELSPNVIIQDNILTNNQNGVLIRHSDMVDISNNTITDGEIGIECEISLYCEVRNNTVLNNSYRGIIISQSHHSIIENNDIVNNSNQYNNDFGLVIESHDCSILNNTIRKNGHGIRSRYSSNCVIQDNRIVENRITGVEINSCERSEITNNNISNNGGNGLTSSWGNNIDLDENIISKNNRYGMELNGPSWFRITRNTIKGNQYSGIQLIESDNCDISNNSITNNTYTGIDLQYSYPSWINYNTISENGYIGILFAYNQDSYISNNILTDNCKKKVHEIPSDALEFLTKSGILMYESHHTVVTDNQFISNEEVAIHFSHSNSIIFKDNRIINNGYGFFLADGSGNNYVRGNDLLNNNQTYQSYSSQASDWGFYNVIIFNYWNDWISPDSDNDGYIDIPYTIDGRERNQDPYPLASENPPTKHSLFKPIMIYPTGGEFLQDNVGIQWLPAIESLESLISYSIYFSSNGGKNWVLIVEEITLIFNDPVEEFNPISIGWETREHYDTTSGRLKIVATTPEGLRKEVITSTDFSLDNGLIEPPGPTPLVDRILLFLGFIISLGVVVKSSRKR